ncbi:hypothetical protein DFH09DRAFT_1196618, partial [Mycena vulgaris]
MYHEVVPLRQDFLLLAIGFLPEVSGSEYSVLKSLFSNQTDCSKPRSPVHLKSEKWLNVGAPNTMLVEVPKSGWRDEKRRQRFISPSYSSSRNPTTSTKSFTAKYI